MKSLFSFRVERMSLFALSLVLFIQTAHSQSEFFEGSFEYNIVMSGKHASYIMENEPNNKMMVHMKDNRFIVNLGGGRIPRTMLYVPDSNQTYIVDMPNKRMFLHTYFIDTDSIVPTATLTEKSETIKGHECQVYKVLKPKDKTVVYYYVCDEFKMDVTKFDGHEGAKADFLTKGLEGKIPLKKVIKSPNLTTTITVFRIVPQEFKEELFYIPPGFTLKKRDPRK